MHLSTRSRTSSEGIDARSRRAQDALWLRRRVIGDPGGSEASRVEYSAVLYSAHGGRPAPPQRCFWAACSCFVSAPHHLRDMRRRPLRTVEVSPDRPVPAEGGSHADDRYQTDLMMKQTFGPRAVP
ncbi:hypothetical protein V8C26DRAFT_396202 [Trichoderma gracile]